MNGKKFMLLLRFMTNFSSACIFYEAHNEKMTMNLIVSFSIYLI